MNYSDKKEYCGLFGVYGRPDAAHLCYQGLYSLQHRGQESAGIAAADGQTIRTHTGMGLVGEVFDQGSLGQLAGNMAIGHVRYSTTGSSGLRNAQPLTVEYSRGPVSVAHNGNLINAQLLRDEYEAYGHIFQTTSDTEVIVALMAKPSHIAKGDPLGHVLNHIQGAYCLLFLYPDRIEAARDPYGIRPLAIGRLADGSYCVASETCALTIVEAEYIREVAPGEIVTLDASGLHSRFFVKPGTVTPAHCSFEHVYFADPSSSVFDENVHHVRKRLGMRLGEESPVDADVVVAIPDSGRSAAMGYSAASGVPLERGFVRNHYIGRTFIQPTEKGRSDAVKMKLTVIRESVDGKRVVVVDDSIVRGTTTRGKIQALRSAGAREIHMRVSCPPLRHPCFYGIDFPTQEELIAHGRTVEEISRFLGVDSLAYLSLEGMLACFKGDPAHYCHACWSGTYRIPVTYTVSKFSLERHQMQMF
ncbi:MAG: Amidophosphoribosyltransferase [Phycisphaerae bacterium]|nr:Amidophosphoribosyltransferase [Phycisphaerae bacterium]